MNRPVVTKHSLELQSLRGIAALVVLVHHSLRTFDDQGWAWFVSEKVLNAHAAVVVFFVLSGYVLTRSIMSRGVTFGATVEFYVRRAFRIIPALWVGIGFGLVYMVFFRPVLAPNMSTWMARYYNNSDFNAPVILFGLAGLDAHLLPTAWTVTIEIVASVVLPVMVWMLMHGARARIILVSGLALVSFIWGAQVRQVPLYMIDFALGALLAASGALRQLKIGPFTATFALIVLLFFRHLGSWGYHDPVPSLIEGFASVALIIAILRSHAVWLQNGVMVSLGNWSYSIYLLHLPIALSMTRLIGHYSVGASANMLAFMVLVSTAILTIPLAAFVYRYVELPGIAAGSRLIGMVKQKVLQIA